MHRGHVSRLVGVAALAAVACLQAACADNPPPVAPEPVMERTVIEDPPEIIAFDPAPETVAPPPAAVTPALTPDDQIASRSLEELNRSLLLEPVFFVLDSAELDERGRQVVEANADMLTRFPTWAVTIEGHCDERGTPEYNLALGERRALAAQRYLLELGLEAGRVRTVSYGKEFPFDPGNDETAWAANRRAHFVITAK